jgi:hypothetical protein
MDKRIAGLLGAAAALTTMTSAQAAPAPAGSGPVTSYRDLLDPVPNAVPLLQADNARLGETQANEKTEVAQITIGIGHHHHHHHVRVRRHHHHHHHHHHHD